MAILSFNTGRDNAVTVVTSAGVLALGLVNSFQSTQDKNILKSIGMDGVIRYRPNYHGWGGSFGITRQDATIDDYFARLEADYRGGNIETPGTLTQTITELDGGISKYRFHGVVLVYDDAGTWAGDSDVKLKVSFMAAERVKV